MKKHYIFIVSVFILFGYIPAKKSILSPPVTFSITDFGAIGDGVTDNYYAFKQAAAYASTHSNTTINFPAGTYYIAKYTTKKNDTVTHIMWNDCVGLKLLGVTGTVISMNGSFFRPLDYFTSDCARKSYTSGISPFYFDNCSDVEVKNMEITGNVQNTTRAAGLDVNNPSVTEGDNILLRFTKCDDVVIDNMYLHHAESDGLTISGDRIAGVWINSKRFRVSNVKSWNNGRQGLSVGGLTDGIFTSCEFSKSGITGGTYGFNDPAAGVDIEPGILHYVDSVKFVNCKFESNRGGQFLSAAPDYTSNITLLKCTVTVTSNEKPQGVTMLSKYSLIDSSFLSLDKRDLKITNVDKPGSTIRITHTTIEATGNFITTSSATFADSVYIANNQFNYLGNTMSTAFFTLQTSNLRFLNNIITISPAAIADKSTGPHAFVQNAIISQGNVFPSGVRVDYTGTTTVADP